MDRSNTSLLDEMLVNLLLMLSGIFFSSAGGWLLCWWTLRQFVIRLHKWLVAPVCEVEGHIKKVDDLFVSFDCDFKAIQFEHLTDSLFGFFNFFWSGLVTGQLHFWIFVLSRTICRLLLTRTFLLCRKSPRWHQTFRLRSSWSKENLGGKEVTFSCGWWFGSLVGWWWWIVRHSLMLSVIDLQIWMGKNCRHQRSSKVCRMSTNRATTPRNSLIRVRRSYTVKNEMVLTISMLC